MPISISVKVDLVELAAQTTGDAPFLPTAPITAGFPAAPVGDVLVELNVDDVIATPYAYRVESYAPGYGDGHAGIGIGAHRLTAPTPDALADALHVLASAALDYGLPRLAAPGFALTAGTPESLAAGLATLSDEARAKGITYGDVEAEAGRLAQARIDEQRAAQVSA